MDKKMTIRDIAREAGVSVATVSYIVNERTDKRISEDTRKRVLQIINLYDYSPSRLAQSFATNQTHNIMLLSQKNKNIFQKAELLDLLTELSRSLYSQKFNLLFMTDIEVAKVDNVDAIIAQGVERKTFRELADVNYIPLISVDASIGDPLFFQISQDFNSLKEKAESFFKSSEFTLAIVDTYNSDLKNHIESIFKSVIYIDDTKQLLELKDKNVVTVNKCLNDVLLQTHSSRLLHCPALSKERINAITESLDNAKSRKSVSTHNILVN